MNVLDWIAKFIVILGALNLGLFGVFQVDLISMFFDGRGSMTSRVLYIVIGLCAVWMLYRLFKKEKV